MFRPSRVVLQESELFRGLPENVLSEIMDAALTKQFSRGADLAKDDTHADALHLILGGTFKLTTAHCGSLFTIKLAHVGETVGDANLLGRIACSFTATAIVRSETLFWPAKRFERIAQSFPQIAANCVRLMVSRERQILRRLRASLSEKAEKRIARSLVDMTIGKEACRSSETVHVSGQVIAALSDTGLYTASRVLSRWKREGILAGGRGHITILDPKRLLLILES